MNKQILLSLLLISLVWLGCDEDDPPPPPEPTWTANHLWPTGSRPVASPDGERVLFLEEGVDGGLYLLENGQARKLNESVPSLRADYCWSHDGTKICFSGPGLPGESSAGIYVSNNAELTSFTRIWDRGSDPIFTRFDEEIICAGPEDGSSNGIWKINLATEEKTRIISNGVQPHLSPDGHKIAYTFSTGSSAGRTLVVFDRQSLQSDTVGTGATDVIWMSDSETLVYERVQTDAGIEGPSRMFSTTVDGFPPGTLLFPSATSPVAIPGTMQFLFVAISGDTTRGLRLSDAIGDNSQFSDSGATAYASSDTYIVAVAPSGIFEITKE